MFIWMVFIAGEVSQGPNGEWREGGSLSQAGIQTRKLLAVRQKCYQKWHLKGLTFYFSKMSF